MVNAGTFHCIKFHTKQVSKQKPALLIADGNDPTIRSIAEHASIPTVLLQGDCDPIAAITTLLVGERFDQLHILAHGRPGGFLLGGQWVDQKALSSSADLLSTWDVAQTLLWTCYTGADKNFTQTLAQLTRSEVYCSDDWIGHQRNETRFTVASDGWYSDPQNLTDIVAPTILRSMEFRLAEISVYFTDGYLGTQGTNTNQANSIKKFSTLGIERASFVQEDTDGDGRFDEVATQGNDIAGTIKLYLSDGSVISLTGALNWRETTGSTIEVLGFIFGPGQTATITYNGGASTFVITGGSTSNTSSTLGLKAFASNFTFTDNQNRSGNAATSGLLTALNNELTSTPQPSAMSLTSASVVEGGNLVYTVTISSATTSTQYFSISTSGTTTSGSDYSADFATYTYSNGVTYVGNGTLRIPSGVSSFTVTIPTTDDAVAEPNETLVLQVGNKAATGTILDNEALLTYGTSSLREGNVNDGSITTVVTITLTGDTFSGSDGENFVTANKVAVTNTPPGLTAVVTRTSATTATLTLTGNASSHTNSDDINNLTVTFLNGAFTTNLTASDVTNYLKNNLTVDFIDAVPTLSYSAGTLVEAAANDGSISTTITITLANDTFTGSDGSNLISGGKATVANVPTGLTAVVTKTSATTATLTLTGNASAHANANDISNLTVTFLDGAFTGTPTASNVTNYQKADLLIDFNSAAVLSYSTGTFVEAAANDGSISTTVTITLTGDTFDAAVVSGGKVTATNVPSGLTASFTRVSNTEISLTLTGTAAAHANANDISNLAVTFLDGAFTTTTLASGVTNYRKTDFVVDYTNPPGVYYSRGSFVESSANDGSIDTTISITLIGDTFSAGVVSSGLVSASNVPSGLTPSFTRISDTEIRMSLSGNANVHVDANDISNLTVTFSDGAFVNTTRASDMANYVKNDLIVDFADPYPRLLYSSGTFSESSSNDGSISTTITITLLRDTFQSDVVSGGKISVDNLPAGLTASFTRIDDNQITLTLTGRAVSHDDLNDLSNLTVRFENGAFSNTARASLVENYVKDDLIIDFIDAVPSLSYSSGTLVESPSNDGSISSSITITLANDTFTGPDGSDLIGSGKVVIDNLPPGLTAVLTKTGPTAVVLTLTGSAAAHANVNDVSNLSVRFLDSAFTTTPASNVTNSQKSDLVVDFASAPTLSYSAGTFIEADANDGSISTTMTVTLTGDTFAGANGSDLLAGGKVSIGNLPPGLTAVVTKTGPTTATITLIGKAGAHTNINDIDNLSVTFLDGAFSNTANASNVVGYQKSDLAVDFKNPPITANLDPVSDTGTPDGITKVIDPDFGIKGGDLLVEGGRVRLLDPFGNEIGSKTIDADDIAAGIAKVSPGLLDDGVYVFLSQILDANGKVIAEVPVTVTIVTDRDGIAPSIELAANNGDFNKDGIKDWEQNNVAQLPLLSLEAFNQGKNAPVDSFGAIIAGNMTADRLGSSVTLNSNAQLIDMSVKALPQAVIPDEREAVTPLFQFSVTAQDGLSLQDADPSRPGLQTQVVIDLPAGVNATNFMKYNANTGEWVDFTNIKSLNGGGDGAVLVDSNRDGRVDRIVVTLTDGGVGDEDGIVNGVIVDPGALAIGDSQAMYSTKAANGDTILTSVASNAMTGIDFYTSPDQKPELVKLKAYYNTLTGDYFYAPEGVAPPYACYVELKDVNLGYVARPGQGAFDVHLYLNSKGFTELVSQVDADAMDLLEKGYRDLGAIFGSTDDINIIVLLGSAPPSP